MRKRDKHTAVSILILLSLAVVGITGCSRDIDLKLPQNKSLKLLIYEGGSPVIEKEIQPNSQKYQKLSIWLEKNREDWDTTYITYVPGVSVSGENFNINFLKESVILNYSGGQYIKDVDPKDYEFLLN